MLASIQRFLASGLVLAIAQLPLAQWEALLPQCSFFGLKVSGIPFLIIFTVLSVVTSFWTASAAEAAWGKDPRAMVVDEWAGMGVSLWAWLWTLGLNGEELSVIHLLVGFVFFRLFDIWKPLGVNSMQKLSGGFGILSDDILAGLYAGIGWYIVFKIW